MEANNFEFADVSDVKLEEEEEEEEDDDNEFLKLLPESILKNDKVDLEAVK